MERVISQPTTAGAPAKLAMKLPEVVPGNWWGELHSLSHKQASTTGARRSRVHQNQEEKPLPSPVSPAPSTDEA